MDYNRNYGHYESTANRIAVGVLIVIVSILCTLSLFGALGGVGNMVASFLTGIFGLVAYAYSVCGIILGAAVTLGKSITLERDKVFKYSVLFFMGVMAAHVWFTRSLIVDASYGDYLKASYAGDTPAGLLGSVFSFPVMKLITPAFALVILVVLFFAAALASFFPLLSSDRAAYRSRGVKIKPRDKARQRAEEESFAPQTENVPAGPVGNKLFVGTIEEGGAAPEIKKATKRDSKKEQGFNLLFPNRSSYAVDADSIVEPVFDNNASRKQRAREKLFGNKKQSETQPKIVRQPIADEPKVEEPPVVSSRRDILKQDNKGRASGRTRAADGAPRSIYDAFDIDRTEEGKIKDFQERFKYILDTDVSSNDVYGAAKGGIKPAKINRENANLNDDADDTDNQSGAEQFVIEPQKPTVQPADNSAMPRFVRDILNSDRKPVVPADKHYKAEIVDDKPRQIGQQQGQHESDARQNFGENRVQSSLEGQNQENAVENKGKQLENTDAASDENKTRGSLFNLKDIEAPRADKADDAPKSSRGSIRDLFGGGQSDSKPVSDTNAESGNSGSSQKFYKPDRTEDAQNLSAAGTGSVGNFANLTQNKPKIVKEMPSFDDIEGEFAENKNSTDSSYSNNFAIGDKAKPVKINPPSPILSNPSAAQPQLPKKPQTEQISIDQKLREQILKAPYIAPPIDLLDNRTERIVEEDYSEQADLLEQTLSEFKIDAKVIAVTQGPTFTRFEIRMPKGVKVKRVVDIKDDIAMKMQALRARIEVPIPGKDAFGVEIPNRQRSIVGLKDIIASEEFNRSKSLLTFALGKDIANQNYVCDLETMPHLLIAGATGTGKSVCINSLIISLLYKASPNDLKLVLIDPKMVELNLYSGLPHLLMKDVIDEPDKAINALDWAIREMRRRFDIFKENDVRNINEYNKLIAGRDKSKRIPCVVFIIDELADFIMTNKHEIEERISKITRLSRAAGIHLVVATQRPSVDYVTGSIKANLPSRIAFSVMSGADSKTILDRGGADKLLGKGDMLYAPQSFPEPVRLQGTLVERDEVKRVVDFIKEHNEAYFDPEIESEVNSVPTNDETDDEGLSTGELTRSEENLLRDALKMFIEREEASISKVQRRFGVGYGKAAKIIDEMEARKYVSSNKGGNRTRDVLITMEDFKRIYGDEDSDIDG